MKNGDPLQTRYFDVCEEWKEGAFVALLVVVWWRLQTA